MSPLTRDEAQQRAGFLDVHEYVIDLDVTGGEESFGSTSTVRFAARSGGWTFLDVRPVVLRRVVLDGVELDAGLLSDGRFPLELGAGEHELRVEAEMPYSRTGEGMHRFTDPADGLTYLYSQCFLDDAPRVFGCFDQPDLKATFAVSVSAPAEWTVLGNGVAERVGEGRWVCAVTPRISTYLVAVVAGPYHSVRAEHAGLPFGLHVRASLAEFLERDAEELLEVTRRCFDRYHEIFEEPYPFDSYDQAFVPEFNAGAMENPGLVTFRDEKIFRSAATETEVQDRAVTVAHEMAHMWFGDLVTLRWWDDVWLNESFADYMGYQVLADATRFREVWTDFGAARKGWGYDADQRGSTHPVAPEPESVPDTATALLNFDGISYAKGASALRQLVAWLGEKAFLAGVNEHFARHRFGNATLADFVDSMARASADRDVHAWADAWLRTTGVDTLTPVVSEGAGGWRAKVEHVGMRPHRLAVGLYDRVAGDRARLVLRERVERDVSGDGVGFSVSGEGPRPDLLLLNDGDLSYAKVRLDEGSWEAVRTSLSGLPGGLSRAVVWNAARDMVRDGQLAPEVYLEAVRAHLPLEADESVVQAVLAFSRGAVADRFLAGRERAGALELLVGVCRALLERTEAGGEPGVRLTAARCLLRSSSDVAELLGWRSAGSVPGGPELDAELGWLLLQRLSVLGAVGERDIAAALAEDRSASGEQGAAWCRAALPDAGAKAAAWEALFGGGDALSNRLFRATAEGFWQPEPEQVELLEPYAPGFFDAAVAVSERRGAEIARVTGVAAFPHAVAGDEVLRLGEELLRSREVIPALGRVLADQLDDLRRVLAVRGAG
ncbi:aminopeptidase N [Streptomyces sp. RKND-216]|uniref:aminopeptidase N n=1 Tax=Streptomyces sp. RKND-216 TaxID=2562581 RepID=UPI00109D8D6B|nr:aminopeptidase N [Streptomyces sp. RKND-216]THA26937.1 aminopeptidase N [Streptomyces sp. RKND-216]